LAFTQLARGERAWIDPRDGQPTQRPLYDGTIFHRVIPGFLIQGGDPTGTGVGGPGFTLPDEIGGSSVFEAAGALGMATRGPNTAGSQFFITDGPAHHLDGHYTRLGTCTNHEVIHALASVPRGERNRPVQNVVLRTVEIVVR
jgi:peptidyl-prolyl cis-trans isomerase A (cyclophilin A)